MRNNNLYIGIVGRSASGKDTLAAYLRRKGFLHISLSDLIRELARKQRSYRGRDDLIRIGNEQRKKYGPGIFARRALERAQQRGALKVVFSSVRNPSEIRELEKGGNFITIEVQAPLRVRFSRMQKRGKIDDQVTFSQFMEQEKRESRGGRHQQQLDTVIAMSDYAVRNTGTKEEFYKKIDTLLETVHRDREASQIINIVLLGPQGSGKGTQAEALVQRYGLYHVEMGKILRGIAKRNTPLGRKIDRFINKEGKLVPDQIVLKALEQQLNRLPAKRGLLFDGYPRNVSQAQALDMLLGRLCRELTHVIYLPISRTTTVRRLELRRTCERCNKIFILGVNLKRGAARCPSCGGRVYQREDDKPRAIAQRLRAYRQQTMPVVRYYRKKRVLISVNGEPKIPQVTRSVLKHLPKAQ
ncbi:MAG: nucleoside monophosphate kinase [Patescibacteria group bacterium]